MGTRGTTGFIADGKTFASYQQYDSYPAGVGVQVLQFARQYLAEDRIREDIKAAVLNLKVVDESGKPTAEEVEALKDFTDSHVSTGSDWYATLRNCQGRPDLIIKSGYILDSVANFNQEEYDWQLDLDANVLRGFQGEYVLCEHPFGALPTDEEFVRLAEQEEEALQNL